MLRELFWVEFILSCLFSGNCILIIAFLGTQRKLFSKNKTSAVVWKEIIFVIDKIYQSDKITKIIPFWTTLTTCFCKIIFFVCIQLLIWPMCLYSTRPFIFKSFSHLSKKIYLNFTCLHGRLSRFENM